MATVWNLWCCLARVREATPTADSDYDVAVFIKELDLPSLEFDRLAGVETDILYDTGAVIDALPFSAGAYRERTGFMHELRRDGLDL
jgi:uncharacterized protein